MTFYTMKYIQNNQNTNQAVLYALMLVALGDCKIVCVRMNDSLNLFL
ncbi:hypothetical protein PRL2021_2041 [Lactobacillus crispatus]|nr:hypothetical protein PRL2021_2041 [Lactobacillus crispatus]